MPQKAGFTPARKQKLINVLREATSAASSARGYLRYHLRMTEPLYKEADDILRRMAALERKAAKELDLPKPEFTGESNDVSSIVSGKNR